jgi:hypothetical protein
VGPYFASLFVSAFSRFTLSDADEAILVFAGFKHFFPALTLGDLHLVLSHHLAASLSPKLASDPTCFSSFAEALLRHRSDPVTRDAIISIASCPPEGIHSSLSSPFCGLLAEALPAMGVFPVERLIAFATESFTSVEHFELATGIAIALWRCQSVASRLDALDPIWYEAPIQALASDLEWDIFFTCRDFLLEFFDIRGPDVQADVLAYIQNELFDPASEHIVKLHCLMLIASAPGDDEVAKELAGLLRTSPVPNAVFAAMTEVFDGNDSNDSKDWAVRFVMATVAERVTQYAMDGPDKAFLVKVVPVMGLENARQIVRALRLDGDDKSSDRARVVRVIMESGKFTSDQFFGKGQTRPASQTQLAVHEGDG